MRHSILVGFGALRASPLRTALSALGVVIGVGALVAVLAVGDGVERYAREEIARTTDLLALGVLPKTTRLLDGLSVRVPDVVVFGPADAEALQRAVGERATVRLGVRGGVLAVGPGAPEGRGVALTGLGAAPAPGDTPPLTAGRVLEPAEFARGDRSALIPADLAVAVGVGVDDSVTLGAERFRVVGLMASAKGPFVAQAPLAAAVAAFAPATPPPAAFQLVATRLEDVPAVRADVEGWLAGRWADWEERVTVLSNDLRLGQTRQALLVFKLLMGAVTGISLVVGGIGIMNVLLASVTERTREIGVRRAAGARRRDILMQFLAESVTITGAGSAVGVLLGIAVATGVAAVMRARTEAAVTAAVTWPTLVVAAGAAVVVGLAAGLYPAIRAARLAPIDAIRTE